VSDPERPEREIERLYRRMRRWYNSMLVIMRVLSPLGVCAGLYLATTLYRDWSEWFRWVMVVSSLAINLATSYDVWFRYKLQRAP
jgi:hypothetical protein